MPQWLVGTEGDDGLRQWGQPSAQDTGTQVGLDALAQRLAETAANAHHFENVTSALLNRDIIGQAKGMLMERFKITSDQAFLVLAKVSQDTNRKLAAVAEELARTGMWTPGSRVGHPDGGRA